MYTQPGRELNQRLIEHAQNSGSKALVITVDTPVLGARNRQNRSYFRSPVRLPNVEAIQMNSPQSQTLSVPLNTTLTWKDVEWMCSIAKVPVLLKGIMNPEDALRSVDSGAAGIIVTPEADEAADAPRLAADRPHANLGRRGALDFAFEQFGPVHQPLDQDARLFVAQPACERLVSKD